MAEKDALGSFDFNKVGGGGLFLKFQSGQPVTVRVLTTDPIVSNKTFTDKKTGEISVSTRFAFIVYNFTEGKAQILQVGPSIAREFGKLHVDQDFGANIRKLDIKITPSGEGLERRYDIKVLQTAHDMTADQVNEAKAIDLDEKVEGGRLSEYDADAAKPVGNNGSAVGSGGSSTPGYDAAKAKARSIGKKDDASEEDQPPAKTDPVIDDIGDEPINLDDIPF